MEGIGGLRLEHHFGHLHKALDSGVINPPDILVIHEGGNDMSPAGR